MEQQSKEWFEARVGRVTGSVVGAILSVDPWRGPDDVMRTMVRDAYGAEKEFKGNIATEYGNEHEEKARQQYQMDYLLGVKNASFEKHEDWLGASPDGYIDEEDAVLEIKCPFSMRNKTPDNFKNLDQQPHYYAQMQVQMFVSGRSKCHFYQWCPAGARLDVVHRDEEYLADVLPKLHNFWLRYCYEVEHNADEHLQPKRKQINTPEAERLLAEYDELAEAADHAKERMAEIKDRLIQMSGERNAEVCGRKLTKIEKAGSVSYAKVVKDNLPDVDLEQYRGKPSSFWKIT